MNECDESVAAKECAVPIDESVSESVCESVWEYGCFPIVETSAQCASTQGKVKISPSRFVDVENGRRLRLSRTQGRRFA